MKKKVTVLFIAMILLVSLISGCGGKQAADSKDKDIKEEKYTPVAIQTVDTRTISNDITLNGKVYANKEVMVSPKIPGKVAAINGHLGAKVKKDSVLFVLDKDDVKKQVEQAKKSVEVSRANYQKTKESIENAKTNFERTKELYKQGAVSKTQYEQAELAASNTSLEAVRVQYEKSKISYDQALDSLSDTSVKSPIEGIISSVNIEEGEMASNAAPAMTIIDMDTVYVEINVTENVINDLYLGQEVDLELAAAYNNDFIGKIDRLSPAADPKTQLYSVRVYVENNEHIIKPGMFAKIKLSNDVRKDVIAVESEAIIQRDDKLVVYSVEDNKAVEKEVEIGLDTGTYVEILKGLNKGDNLIIKGQNYVEDGSIVKVVRGDK